MLPSMYSPVLTGMCKLFFALFLCSTSRSFRAEHFQRATEMIFDAPLPTHRSNNRERRIEDFELEQEPNNRRWLRVCTVFLSLFSSHWHLSSVIPINLALVPTAPIISNNCIPLSAFGDLHSVLPRCSSYSSSSLAFRQSESLSPPPWLCYFTRGN